MEEIRIQRLRTIADCLKNLSSKAMDACPSGPRSSSTLEQARIAAAKLQSIINRFNTELCNYFNSANNPNADEISQLTLIQLEGEEVLAELNARLLSHNDTKENVRDTTSARSKLPELKLPSFKGDVLEWYQFWDQFSSNIDQRSLSDVDKLLYLKSSLTGEAKAVVEGLETTNLNYQIAVTTLKERYGKKNMIIDAHYSTLYKIPRAQKFEDCRKTLDEIDRHLRVLQALGEDTNRNHLRFLIMEKFPEDIVYEMKLRLDSESIEEMRKYLANIITMREDARSAREGHTREGDHYTTEALHIKEERATTGPSRFRKTYKLKRDYKPNTSRHTKHRTPVKRKHEDVNQVYTNNTHIKRKRLQCVFCQGTHYPDQCDKYITAVERKKKMINRCFGCLRPGHLIRQCQVRQACVHCGNVGRHHRSLCPRLTTQRKQPVSKEEPTQALHVGSNGTTILQTAVVQVTSTNNKSKECRILLDSGSQRTYVTQRIANELNLKIEEKTHLYVFTFGSNQPREMDSSLVTLDMTTRTNQSIRKLYANVVPSITQGIPCPEVEVRRWVENRDRTLADDGSLSDQVDILIGNDYYYSLMSTEKIQIKKDLYLVNSKFGWILSGRIEDNSRDDLSVLTYFQSSNMNGLTVVDPPLDNGSLKFLWDLESIGITDSPKTTKQEEAIKHFNENAIYKKGRYFVSWPWNEHPPNLPSNFGLAYGRLTSLVKRMASETLLTYDKIIQEQLDKGIIELVPEDNKDHVIHYLPHHGVSAPGKALRIVYDASAKVGNGKSLNECLYCGPMMLEELTGLLIKFRGHTIGVTADVEKAFLQIGLHENDRDVTRFLWLRNVQEPVTRENLVHLRFTRVPFGVISSPFLLNATIKHHLQNSGKEKIRQLANDIYVDNVLTGSINTQGAFALYKDSKEAFRQISMNLREWSSNSKEFMCAISDTCEDTVVKTLGLNWNLDEDSLCLKTKETHNTYTKRGVLKTIASIYDPCGFATPIVLPAKLLLQDLWKEKVKWDAPLSEDAKTKWKAIEEDLKQTDTICIPRRICTNEDEDCQLHCFTDSSTKAYAAVIYIVQRNTIRFLIGKSRLVPTKDQDHLKIPRLELLGVLIGSRLIQYVLKSLQVKISHQTLWTDSQIVIDWHRSDKLLVPFVSRRIEEIKRNKALTIRYVSSNLNPADVATRPTNLKEDYARWLNGPDFLTLPPGNWPIETQGSRVLLAREGLSNGMESSLPNIHKDKMEVDETTPTSTENISSKVQEIKKLQKQAFPEEVKGRKTHLTRNLGLFTDVDGILRCDGRLTHSDLSYDAKHPILLPRDSNFTHKVIKDTHEQNYHVGVPHTLSIIRQQYWIPQGRAQVQKVVGNCPQCVKHGGGPYKLPETPSLPPERVNYSKAYTYTGMDYLGPVLVKSKDGKEKRWICLFTCLVVRAIFLEIVKNLTAEECLLAVKRFIASRGVPDDGSRLTIISDNAAQFRLLADVIQGGSLKNQVHWKFIPQLAPWHGAAYERLIALVKHCLKRTLEKHLLEENQLLTIIKEVEAVVNTRPLTYVGSNLEHTIRPTDFLTPGKCMMIDPVDNQILPSDTSTKRQLIESWKRGETIMKEYKDMFVNRYLLSLRERYHHSPKQPRVKTHRTPCIGDVVQIKGEVKNRETWKVGRIVDLIKGSDGLCRVAKVKVGETIFTRSIGHLYPLEADETEQYTNPSCSQAGQEEVEDTRSVEQDDHGSIPVKELEERIGTRSDSNTLSERTQEIDQESLIMDHITDMDESIDSMDVVSNDALDNEDSGDNANQVNEKPERDPPTRQGHQRAAAARAREKIREWTRNLLNLLH